jgi:3-deoxy-D-manno-octulosonic-acid transferase
VGAVSAEDAARLVLLGCRDDAVHVTGDTRFDQVIARARTTDPSSPLLASLRSDRPTLVAGSTWPADEQSLLAALASAPLRDSGLRTIIAPHEPTPGHVSPIERWASASGLRHATLGSSAAAAADIIIVDRVGVLGDLYALADMAFVGGGFHAAGLHSVLEPAAYGVPVIFGPRHEGSRDAGLLLEAGGARSAHNASGIIETLGGWLEHPEIRRNAGAAAQRVVEANAGATDRSVALVESLLSRRAPP